MQGVVTQKSAFRTCANRVSATTMDSVHSVQIVLEEVVLPLLVKLIDLIKFIIYTKQNNKEKKPF